MKLYFDDGPMAGKVLEVPADRAKPSVTIEDKKNKTDHLYHARRRVYFTPPAGGSAKVEGIAYGYVKEAEWRIKREDDECRSS